jgi:catechol 2,3-dioxygenase-like lactoylglutathione lyase family enzyme
MYSHSMGGVEGFDASKAFYDAIFGLLGVVVGQADGAGPAFYLAPSDAFGVTKPVPS